MRVFFTLISILFILVHDGFSQVTLAEWTFNNVNTPSTSIPSNSAQSFSTTAAGSLIYSSGCGTGCSVPNPPFYSIPDWTGVSPYWQTTISTLGYETITLSSTQRSSNTGPANFTLQVDSGSGFTTVSTITVANNFTTGVLSSVSLGASAANKSSITIRWVKSNNTAVNASPVAPSGTSGIDAVLITGTAIPMPVVFINFSTKLLEKSFLLSFSTASETNNDYFTIERSGDGRSFESIGEIKGAGNSNQELSYEFVDESPLAGINYYRIKQTDFDGAYSYTEIRSVRHQTKNVIVSPNRTDGKLNVTSELDNYDVVIYNTGGQEVQRHMALSGDQSLSIETLQAGVYFVKVMDQTIRILKF
ncbi:MAG TPA: T9SS type A sorting domain-containing protein [Saprospiraceae bacterium]|jgi:hypothetical protein|nr:T9SS type A sorting domain-containing protein [Saprospiraceae bacterium]HMT68807.1 T9SS type A sorting domain-containing protein [Saprospiraceae bacterium]